MIRFSHTNIIARDWKSLAKFYAEVFGCRPVGPERDLTGGWIDTLTGIKNVNVKGVHMSLPGCNNGPTLEIFEYLPCSSETLEPAINRYGFGHIAFLVDDVEETLKQFIERGGTKYGGIIKKEYPGVGLLTAIYAKDPEGNFVEIQNWGK